MYRYLVLFLLLAVSATADTLTSGLAVGERAPAHHPLHITGPDAGTDICPV